jgi:hypothetical protein
VHGGKYYKGKKNTIDSRGGLILLALITILLDTIIMKKVK